MAEGLSTEYRPMIMFSPEWSGECKVCRDNWRLFEQPELLHDIDLGSRAEALATQCHTHKPLIHAFIEAPRELPDRPISAEHSILVGRWWHSPEVMITCGTDNEAAALQLTWDLLVMKKEPIPHHPGNGRILNPDWIDLEMLRGWKNKCFGTYGAECANPMKVWPTRPTYLIDVKKKCLVTGLVSGDFVALSFTYGRAVGATMGALTLEMLQKPHALDSPDFDRLLSPTIRHAMSLTSAISERYLWADALCIPHFHEVFRTKGLRMMGAIYANAVVTVVVADGDSQDGLSGLEGTSAPRNLN